MATEDRRSRPFAEWLQEQRNLRIGYILDRPDLVTRAAFDDVLVSLESSTGFAAFHGKAPA